MQSVTERSLAAVIITAAFFCLLVSLAAAVHAAWIPLKAELAQVLLERSWDSQKSGVNKQPWPWADTHAVARLQVPRLELQQIVLEGSSGRNLAFGPVLSSSSQRVEDWIINGHRDTHFRFLQDLQAGDELLLETVEGEKTFRVDTLEIIDSREFELVLQPGAQRLSLVTCYPFDAATAGGPLRYVVTASLLDERLKSSASVSKSTGRINPPVSSSG